MATVVELEARLEALKAQLSALLRRDPSLKPIAKAAGPFEIRLTPAGFAGLAPIT
mgnify:CR=1 FL=1